MTEWLPKPTDWENFPLGKHRAKVVTIYPNNHGRLRLSRRLLDVLAVANGLNHILQVRLIVDVSRDGKLLSVSHGDEGTGMNSSYIIAAVELWHRLGCPQEKIVVEMTEWRRRDKRWVGRLERPLARSAEKLSLPQPIVSPEPTPPPPPPKRVAAPDPSPAVVRMDLPRQTEESALRRSSGFNLPRQI